MAASSLMVPLGTQAPDFALPDTTGTMTGRDDFTAAPALLVAFLCNHCPYVRHIETALGTVLSRYPDLAVRRLAYRGAFDQSTPGNGKPVTGELLRAAIELTLAGQPVPEPHRPSMGCSIKWRS